MLHMGLGPLVLSATSPYATYVACCNKWFQSEIDFWLSPYRTEWDWPSTQNAFSWHFNDVFVIEDRKSGMLLTVAEIALQGKQGNENAIDVSWEGILSA